MSDINPIVWIILVVSGGCAVGTLVLAGIDSWCKRQNARSPFRYWCVKCDTGTPHDNGACLVCSGQR
jgi:hypothetical protein